jgi:hypothetical protein
MPWNPAAFSPPEAGPGVMPTLAGLKNDGGALGEMAPAVGVADNPVGVFGPEPCTTGRAWGAGGGGAGFGPRPCTTGLGLDAGAATGLAAVPCATGATPGDVVGDTPGGAEGPGGPGGA